MKYVVLRVIIETPWGDVFEDGVRGYDAEDALLRAVLDWEGCNVRVKA